MVMLADDQIILTDGGRNKLIQIDLTTHEYSYFYYKFTANHQDDILLHHFLETNLLCVEERVKDHNCLHLTYYCLPLILGGQPIAYYNSTRS